MAFSYYCYSYVAELEDSNARELSQYYAEVVQQRFHCIDVLITQQSFFNTYISSRGTGNETKI